jgi:hypothetical protein
VAFETATELDSLEVQHPDLLRHHHLAEDLPVKTGPGHGEPDPRNGAGEHDHTQTDDDDPPPLVDETAQAGRGQHQHHAGDEIEPEPDVPGLDEAADAGLNATQLTHGQELGRRWQIAEESQVNRIRP